MGASARSSSKSSLAMRARYAPPCRSSDQSSMRTCRSPVRASTRPSSVRAERCACSRRRCAGSASAACAKSNCRGLKRLGLPSASGLRTRKNVTWNPSGPFDDSRWPVTYHHSMRCPGCAPASRGNSSVFPGTTGSNPKAGNTETTESTENTKKRKEIYDPPVGFLCDLCDLCGLCVSMLFTHRPSRRARLRGEPRTRRSRARRGRTWPRCPRAVRRAPRTANALPGSSGTTGGSRPAPAPC